MRATSLLVGGSRASAWRTARASGRGRPVVVGRHFRVHGARGIEVAPGGRLMLGVSRFGWADQRLGGLLRVRGRLHVDGAVDVAVGCRVDVGPDAEVRIGDGTTISPRTLLVASQGTTIGERCAISWDCQLLDDDFTELWIEGRPSARSAPITLGDHVWLGSRVVVVKGARLAPGTVVAAGSVVVGHHDEPNCLLAGSPARVVRRDVSWR